MRRTWVALAFAAFAWAFGVVGSAAAGTIADDLQQQLDNARADELVPGIVVLQHRLDLEWVESQIAANQLRSRWQRHEFVLGEARALAESTQGDLLAELEALRADGLVGSFRTFWIVNAVAVSAVPSVFERLALRPDVDMIYYDAPVELRLGWKDEPAGGAAAPLPYYPGQICINVGSAWDRGYKGVGRIVAAFDTGVDGDHEALADKWRGAQPDVPWNEAWYDPYTGSTFPWDSGSHGTHVTGIMVAIPPTGEPIGIAHEAQWIAAGILIGYNVSAIISAYEWGADPDENPGTIDDVPDVVNNSWGTSGDCDATFWGAIDVVEAAGVVNTIAVDNTGPAPGSVNSPESRAATPYVNFGVGNVNPHAEGCPIANSSGRGPSPCDGVSIKPEVTAPGTQIYSTTPGNNYASFTGTSMACPHVSGAVAILRQANPDLTVDYVKQVLMETARDQGSAGEDNTYGWGVIDVGAALDRVLSETISLPAPRNLVAQPIEVDAVELTWERPFGSGGGLPSAVIRYYIYRTESGTSFPSSPIDSVESPTLSYIDAGLPSGIYDYAVTALYPEGESGPSNVATAPVGTVSSPELPVAARLLELRNSPNPFRPYTTLQYSIHAGSPARLTVFDAGGRIVRTMELDGSTETGRALWDGRDQKGVKLPSGIYFAQLEQSGAKLSRRMVMIR
jgi:bacillopeptidase F